MLTDLGRYAVRRVRGMAQPGDPVLQMRITLADVDGPPVWRQVLIPAGYTLDRVHSVIQAAMGWQNSHLPPHRRAVHISERYPHLEHRIARLSHAADPADRLPVSMAVQA